MTDKQQLEKYAKERATLTEQRRALDIRIEALDQVIGGLQVMTGATPAKARRSKATGTAAILIDVLADGQRRTLRQIAAAANVSPAATSKHLTALVAAGDVNRQGKSRATTYGIA